ncbi:hypothetical protein [Pseudomonas protegens]
MEFTIKKGMQAWASQSQMAQAEQLTFQLAHGKNKIKTAVMITFK